MGGDDSTKIKIKKSTVYQIEKKTPWQTGTCWTLKNKDRKKKKNYYFIYI